MLRFILFLLPAFVFTMKNDIAFHHGKKVSLTVLISTRNHQYYYENKLAKDGSNLKAGWHKEIIKWSKMLQKENGKANVYFILKVQEKDSLNQNSTKLIEYFKSQQHFKQASLTSIEKQFLKIIEEINYPEKKGIE